MVESWDSAVTTDPGAWPAPDPRRDTTWGGGEGSLERQNPGLGITLPAPRVGGETAIPDATLPEFFSSEVHTGQTEVYPAGRAVLVPATAGPDAESATDAESGDRLSDAHRGAYAFAHLSGSALSSAFSKALMKSALPSAEKARILSEVTSVTNLTQKEQARRDWLAKLM
ncbi:MAG: hypothetical protein M3Q07_28775 [Pseudobdellovibrionaceae bacterium]|nr:hypothetical protein [Pseudobdellovibrionaceae bacterium]